MSPTYFKFTTPEGVNRRVTFSEQPAWSLLASKLHALYGISVDNVGVSYVDSDNDEITVSSDDELQDFYKMSHQVGQVIKFAVVDLHSQNNAGKPLEFPSLNRNPFDADAFEFVGGWERFPSVLVAEEDKSTSPHAFVEVLSSNNSVAHDHTSEKESDVDDTHSTVQPPLLDKGKGRSLSFGAASITSVLGEETSYKHPIHVYDVNSRKDSTGNDNNFDDPSVYIHVAAQSTPKVQAKNVDDNADKEEIPTAPKVVEVDDPPLPSLDEFPASATSASLVQDLASVVHDAIQVVSSHPELSESLRNIGRNISTGTYWTTYREALSNAVNGISNPPLTEERRRVEEEAAIRRLTDMVDTFFRTLSQAPVGTEGDSAPNINENPSEQSRGESFTRPSPWWGMRFHGPLGRMAGRRSHHHGHFPPYGHFPHEPYTPGSRPHIPPMYHPHPPHGMPHNSFSRPPSSSHSASRPLPPSPPHAPASLHPSHHSTFSHVPSPTPLVPEKTGSSLPPPPPHIPSPNGSPTAMPGMRSSDIQSHGPSINDRRQSYQGYVPSFPISDDQIRSQPPRPSAQDLRASVEAAKRVYKAEKERYRQERDQRHREKLARRPTVQYSATYVEEFSNYSCADQAYRIGSAPVAQAEIPKERETLSTQFQGMHPKLEGASVPRRSNTHLGHGPFRHFKVDDLTTRAIARITKKLSDVGYLFW